MVFLNVPSRFGLFERLSPKAKRLKELRALVEKSGLFDPRWYILDNHDVRESRKDPLTHFIEHGDIECRSPGPGFNSPVYAATWPDVAASNMGPLEHFLRVGRAAGRAASAFTEDFLRLSNLRIAIHESGLFDADWYREQYPDVRDPSFDVLRHVAFHGAKEGRDPGPNFSNSFYALAYVEHLEADQSPLEHYLFKGRAQRLKLPTGTKYEQWLDLFDRIDEDDRILMRRQIAAADFPPLTIVHVFDRAACPDAAHIIDALGEQISDRWTAVILFAADVPEAERAAVAARADGNTRIRVAGDLPHDIEVGYVLLVHGPVRLLPHAAFLFVDLAQSRRPEFAYCDHDQLTKEGRRRAPSFKPAFSPELLRNRFYVGPCVLMNVTAERRPLLQRIAADLCNNNGDELSDALLAAPRGSVAHAPFVVYSVAGDAGDLSRRPRKPEALADADRPTVSIIIATRDRIELLRNCIDSIEKKMRYPRELLDIVVVDNASVTREATRYFAELHGRAGYRVVADSGDFNFARLYNFGARESRGNVLILLNNDMVVIDPGWIERIVTQCLKPDVGAVGAKLLYPDGTVQHGGCSVGVAGLAAHRLVGKKAEDVADTDATREVAAVTGACLGIRRDVFESVGGLDETLRVAFNDVKLCLMCLERGLRNIYIAQPLLYHFESKSRGFDRTRKQSDLQQREAVHTRRQHVDVFRSDPYYSPNLSVEQVDDFASPPRGPKPWRRPSGNRPPRVMFLSSTYVVGNGVPIVLQMQARRMLEEDFEVIVVGPRGERGAKEYDIAGCRRIHVPNPQVAAGVAVRENVDCVIVHTPPFFSITRYLGFWPMVYFFDHGEPNPEFFPDRRERELADWEKRFCAPLATRVFAISRTIKEQSLNPDMTVLRNGNSHLSEWTARTQGVRRMKRDGLGWEDKFVVLSVCRFTRVERFYKGVDKFIELKEELWFSHPDTRGKVVFVLAGKADEEDIVEMEDAGLSVFANVSDRLMTELYAASDLYISFSKWEGYNLGIGQALAMGLPVIASDIEAHREFPIDTTNSVSVASEKLYEHFTARRDETKRRATIFDWDEPVGKLVDIIRSDLRSYDRPEYR
jgi:GT2 family glycosyltransferase/glycosyltransferase involved in cell wall biosynthesis